MNRRTSDPAAPDAATGLSADVVARAVESPTASGIAEAIGTLIADGTLGVGERLPTVRALAAALQVSPSTVSDTWRLLRTHGVIETDRRRGTTVRSTRPSSSGRYWHVPVQPGTLDLDLSTGTPDPALLPSLGPSLHRVQLDLAVTSYLDRPVIPELHHHLAAGWPFEAEALTVVDGAQDALDRLIGAVVGFGDRVVVEDPTFPPLLDILELAGARIIGVPLDQDGIRADLLAGALETDPVAIILQPRAHNPTGIGMSARRAADIAALLDGTETIVIEDDHSGAVAGAPLYSIGCHRPAHTVHVHSFSKSHGPDLRIAAIGGAAEPIEMVVRRRQLGPSWTSRLMQQVLLDLLTDVDVEGCVADTAKIYAHRRAAAGVGLSSRGIQLGPAGSGLNLWVPVDDDHAAVVALAARGIGAAPGQPFEVDAGANRPHVRLTISSLDLDGPRGEAVLDAVAEAASGASAASDRSLPAR